MLLALWCSPAFAAGSDVLCENAAAANVSLNVPVAELSIAVVDLQSTAPSVIRAPRVETILREIFNEIAPEDHEDEDAIPSAAPHAAPLAELTAPDLREKSRNIDDAEIREDTGGVNGVSTRVPGLSEDDLSRYRRHMFRTDI